MNYRIFYSDCMGGHIRRVNNQLDEAKRTGETVDILYDEGAFLMICIKQYIKDTNSAAKKENYIDILKILVNYYIENNLPLDKESDEYLHKNWEFKEVMSHVIEVVESKIPEKIAQIFKNREHNLWPLDDNLSGNISGEDHSTIEEEHSSDQSGEEVDNSSRSSTELGFDELPTPIFPENDEYQENYPIETHSAPAYISTTENYNNIVDSLGDVSLVHSADYISHS